MIENLELNKKLWFLVAIFSLIASLIGVIKTSIYDGVVSSEIMPGVLGQDLMTILVSIFVIYLVFSVKEKDYWKQIALVGSMGFFFYAYGIYVIEQIYTILYYVYMVIFGLSTYTLVYNLVTTKMGIIKEIKLPKSIRISSSVYSLIIAFLFTALWISALYPLILTGERIEYLYSIYIIDLCFIMPAFAYVGIESIRNKKHGILLMPILFVLGSPLIGSLALSEAVKPLVYGTPMDMSLFGINLVVSVIFTILAVLYLWNIKLSYKGNSLPR